MTTRKNKKFQNEITNVKKNPLKKIKIKFLKHNEDEMEHKKYF